MIPRVISALTVSASRVDPTVLGVQSDLERDTDRIRATSVPMDLEASLRIPQLTWLASTSLSFQYSCGA